MATALELNAQSTLINGQGLSTSPDVLSAISSFSNLSTVKTVGSIYTHAGAISGNAGAVLIPALEQLGSGVTTGRWLIDLYPANISAVSSSSVYLYSTNVPSVIHTVSNQANLPFTYGVAGFANVFSSAYGFASGGFDTIGSIHILENKTYAGSGVGYNGIADLVTNGIGSNGPLLGNTVANWGTMYNINNMNLIGDPYVFGQNLLDQGLGSYGNLAVNLTAAGLDIADITKIPVSTTSTTQLDSSVTNNTIVGQVELPTLNSVSSTTLVTGSSPEVVMNIYRQVTGDDLQAIVTATGIVADTTKLKTLADYLDFSKVVAIGLQPALAALNVRTFNDFGSYLHNKIGQGSFINWAAVSKFLKSIVVPVLSNTTTSANAPILSASTINTLRSANGTGSGELGNPIMTDYFGAAAGMPYTDKINSMVSNYTKVAPTAVASALTLDQAVVTWVSGYSPGDEFTPEVIPSVTPVTNAVTAVNSALNALPNSQALLDGQTAQYQILNKLSVEVSAVSSAGLKFLPTSSSMLKTFATSFIGYATDTDRFQSAQLLANLVTKDAAGDTLRAAVSENTNIRLLSSVGITSHNDASPDNALYQAKAQNLPLSTYLSQNK